MGAVARVLQLADSTSLSHPVEIQKRPRWARQNRLSSLHSRTTANNVPMSVSQSAIDVKNASTENTGRYCQWPPVRRCSARNTHACVPHVGGYTRGLRLPGVVFDTRLYKAVALFLKGEGSARLISDKRWSVSLLLLPWVATRSTASLNLPREVQRGRTELCVLVFPALSLCVRARWHSCCSSPACWVYTLSIMRSVATAKELRHERTWFVAFAKELQQPEIGRRTDGNSPCCGHC